MNIQRRFERKNSTSSFFLNPPSCREEEHLQYFELPLKTSLSFSFSKEFQILHWYGSRWKGNLHRGNESAFGGA